MSGGFKLLFADVLGQRMQWQRKEEKYGLGMMFFACFCRLWGWRRFWLLVS